MMTAQFGSLRDCDIDVFRMNEILVLVSMCERTFCKVYKWEVGRM